MAIADTAELVVALKLRDQLSSGLRGVQSSLGNLDRNVSGISSRISRTGQIINTALGVGLERAVQGGIGLLANTLREGVVGAQTLEQANIQTAAAIKSTGAAAGQTTEGIRAMSEAFEAQNALIDDKVIQAGANVLLTFRNIRKDAFEPALQSALDLSTAMHQDLQSSILQIGKALNDPVRGLTALRRAGVQLSPVQEKQIKDLVEQNRLYDAQQIILGELNKEFGGSFAAQGQTDAARAAKLRDSIEDLQITFAQGLQPAISNVREALIKLFDDPGTKAGVANLSKSIANFLSPSNIQAGFGAVKGVFSFLAEVPWRTIGEGLRITGQAAKIAVDAFLALPPQVQGIAVAALAVNKLSGGVAGSLAGGLAKSAISVAVDLFKNRGTTPANPLFVADVAGGLGGGAPGIPGGAGGGFLGGLGKGIVTGGVLAGAAAATAEAVVQVQNFDQMRNEQKAGLQKIVDQLPRETAGQIDQSISRLQAQISENRPFIEGILFNTNVKPQLDQEIAELRAAKTHLSQNNLLLSGQAAQARTLASNTINEFRLADNHRRAEANHLAAISTGTNTTIRATKGAMDAVNTRVGALSGIAASQNAKLAGILAKPTTFNLYAQLTANVNGSVVSQVIRRQQIAVGRGFTPTAGI